MYPLQNKKIVFGEEWIEEYEISSETALEWKASNRTYTLILKGTDKPIFLGLNYSGSLNISADELRVIKVLGYFYIPPCKHIVISMKNCTLSKIFEVVEPSFSEPVETQLEVIDHPGWTLNDFWHSATSGFLEFKTPIMGFMEFIFWGSGELYSAAKVGEDWIPTSKRLKPFSEKSVGIVPISVSNRLYNSGSMNLDPAVKFYSFGIVEEYDVSTIAGVLSGLLTGSIAGEVIR
ncbi:MAG: hypothetical protein J7M38_10610 [Armatimonadetes bacterium]|nr:hypothetical protein [Armatimonadota bacterium]